MVTATLSSTLRGSLFRERNFRFMWGAATVSAFGYYVTDIAIPLLAIDELNVTSFEAGLIRVVQQLPNLLFGLVLGVFVDRMRKKPLLVWADVLRAVVLLAIPVAALRDHLNLPLVLAVVFLVGGLNLLFDVSEGAFVPHVIPRDRLVEGNSKIEASYASAQMGGPAIGGALVSLVTAPFAILITLMTLLASAGLIKRIKVDEPPAVVVPERSVRGDIAEGLRFVWGHRLMRPLLLTSVGHSFFGWIFMSVYVLYMKRELDLSDFQVGLVFAAGGVGSLIGTLITPRLNDRFGVGPVIVGGNLLFGVTGMFVPVAVLMPEIALPLVVAAEFLQYLCLLPFFLNTITLLQLQSPDAMRGRVMSSRKFLTWGVQPFGSLIGGVLGGVITLPWTLAVGEFGLLAVGIWLLSNPISRLNVVPHGEEPAHVVAA